MSAKLFWRCLHWQGQWTWNRVAFMVVLKEFCEQPDQVFWTFYKVVWSSIQCQRRSRKYCTWRCGSLISQETVLSFQVVFVSSGCAGLLVAWSRLAAVDSIQQCVFEQSSCVWAEQSSAVCFSRESQEMQILYTLHAVNLLCLKPIVVLCSGLAIFGGNASFTTMAELALDFAATHKRTYFLWWALYIYYAFHTDLRSCPSLPNFLPSSSFLSARSGKKYDA